VTGACHRRTVRCLIVRDDGTSFEGTNTCEVDECRRMSYYTGQGYAICGSIHAEAHAAAAAGWSEVPGTAYLSGHDYICGDCQQALASINVRRFVIGEQR
jgi:deoxycytidylate deaminase